MCSSALAPGVCRYRMCVGRGEEGKGASKSSHVPKRLPIPMSDDRYRRQPIPNLERKLVKIDVGIEKIALVLAPRLEREILALRLGQEVLHALRARSGDALLRADLLAVAVGAFLVDDGLACGGLPRVGGLRGLGADAQDVYGGEERAVEVGLVAVDVAVETGVDPPLYDAEGFVEERGEAVADGVVEVVAPDEGGAVEVVLGREGEGDGVAVVGVLRGGEVRRGGGGAFGEAWEGVLVGVCGGGGFGGGCRVRREGRRTAVVFHADVYPRVEVLRGDVYGLLGVDAKVLVGGRVVGRAGGDFEDVLLVVGRHGGRGW